MKKKVVLRLVLFSLFISCQQNASKNTKTLIFCSEGSPVKLNPQVATDGPSFTASANTVFDRLIEYKMGSTQLEAGLAKRWEVSPNGLEYTFYLRKNVSFHSNDLFTPTRPFNADDVIDSLQRMRDKNHPLHNINGSTFEYYNGLDIEKNLKSIIKEGDYRVKIVLKQPEAPFLTYFALGAMSITSKEYGEKLVALGKPELFDMRPIGTGPFIFKKYVKDTLIRYKAFKKHFSKAPLVDHLIISITPNPNVRFQKLKTGECHLISEPARSDLEIMKNHEHIQLAQEKGMNVGYLAINTTKAPLNKKKVRQAINMALNKKSYKKAIYFGHAMIAKNPFPPSLWSYNDDIVDYEYDPKKAKELLAEAGHPQGFSTELWVLPVSRPYNPDGRKMGEMMQADLKKIGIQAKIISYDWGTYLDKTSKGEHSMAQLGWSADFPDPDNFLNILLSCHATKTGSNVSRFCHKEFDRLINEAKRLTSKKKRAKLYRKAQEIFKEEAPWVPIAHSVFYRAMRKNVKGHVISPLGGDFFHTISLK